MLSPTHPPSSPPKSLLPLFNNTIETHYHLKLHTPPMINSLKHTLTTALSGPDQTDADDTNPTEKLNLITSPPLHNRKMHQMDPHAQNDKQFHTMHDMTHKSVANSSILLDNESVISVETDIHDTNRPPPSSSLPKTMSNLLSFSLPKPLEFSFWYSHPRTKNLPLIITIIASLQILIYTLSLLYNGGFSSLILNPTMGASPTTLSTFGILNPARVIYLGEYWRIISCNFLVSGLLELLSNLITLFFAGRKIEFQIGSAATLTLFTFSAIISPLMSIQLQRNVVTTGACAFPIALIGAGIVHHQVSLTQSPLALKSQRNFPVNAVRMLSLRAS